MKAEDLRQMETGRAYEIVKRLLQLNQQGILNKLSEAVTVSDKKRGKLHQVFKPELAQVCSMAFVWLRTCVAIIVLWILMAQVRYR